MARPASKTKLIQLLRYLLSKWKGNFSVSQLLLFPLLRKYEGGQETFNQRYHFE